MWQRITFQMISSEKAMAPHSSTLAWKIPWTEEPARLQSVGSLESDTTERLHFHFSLSCTGEGNGNPLQCSCLENPRDGGTWWAAVYGVSQSRTWLKWISSSSSSCSSNVLLSSQALPQIRKQPKEFLHLECSFHRLACIKPRSGKRQVLNL